MSRRQILPAKLTCLRRLAPFRANGYSHCWMRHATTDLRYASGPPGAGKTTLVAS